MTRKSNRASQTAVGTGVEDSQWRRVHPITPLAKTWAVFVALIAFFTYQNADIIREIAESGILEMFGLQRVLLAVVAGILGVILIAGIYSWLAWRRMSFAVTNEAVYYREGILIRNQRHARLSRVQAVNITHPLIGRIFHLGNIEIEVAGGAGSSLKFGLLKTEELEELRREIMYKAAGAKQSAAAGGPGIAGDPRVSKQGGPGMPGAADAGVAGGPGSGGPSATAGPSGGTQAPGGPAAPDVAGGTHAPHLGEEALPQGAAAATSNYFGMEEPAQVIYKVPTGRLLAATSLDLSVLITVAIGLLTVVASVMSMIIFAASPVTLIPVLIAALVSISTGWRMFSTNFNFTASVTSDGVRVTSGLTATRAQTIPPRRIHGVTVTQPFFWRFFGWYRVSVIQAGFAAADQNDSKVNHSILLPVGTRDQMLRALWMVYPDLGVRNPIGVINAGIEGEGVGPGFIPNPERSKVFDWISWRRRAIMLTDVVVIIRQGRITRRMTVLPYGRFQSVAIEQGPLDRARRLVNIQFQMVQDSSAGYHKHMDEAVGTDVFREATRRALFNREQESPEAWAKRTMAHSGQASEQLFSQVLEDAPQTVASGGPAHGPAGPAETPAQKPDNIEDSGREDQ